MSRVCVTGLVLVCLTVEPCKGGTLESSGGGDAPKDGHVVGYSTARSADGSVTSPKEGPSRRRVDRFQVTIQYSDERDLSRFVSRLRTGIPGFLQRWSGASVESLLREANEKVDQLVARIETLLGFPVLEGRTTVILTADRDSLRKMARQMYGPDIPDHRAFFAPGRNVVVVSASTVTPNMLAHELAHAILHAYFGDTPVPARSQEVLAQYVDTHLYDR